MSKETYEKLSGCYNDLGISDFSVRFGRSIRQFFEDENYKAFRTLDLCCGTGNMCRLFADAGLETFGIDSSPEMVKIAREISPKTEFLCADITEASDLGTFDFITCIDDSINHITNPEDLQKIFDFASDSLPEGGFFIFDIINEDALVLEEAYDIKGKGGLTGTYTVKETGNGLIQISLTASKEGKELFTAVSDEKVYDRSTIWSMLMDSGFTMPVCTTAFYEETTELKFKIVAQKV